MSDELKPCPFCGSVPTVDQDTNGDWYIICEGDDCHAAISELPDRDWSIEAWNRRAGEGYSTSDRLEAWVNVSKGQSYDISKLDERITAAEDMIGELNGRSANGDVRAHSHRLRIEALEAEHKGSPQVDGGREIE